jgi:hypothetical protein
VQRRAKKPKADWLTARSDCVVITTAYIETIPLTLDFHSLYLLDFTLAARNVLALSFGVNRQDTSYTSGRLTDMAGYTVRPGCSVGEGERMI